MKNLLQRIWLVLAVGLCLSLAAAGTSAASSAATETARPVSVTTTDDLLPLPAQEHSSSMSVAAACPLQPGQRVKTASAPHVYLIGPGGDRYYIPNETVYFSLWDSWDGISIISDSVYKDCGFANGVYYLWDAILAKTTSSPRTYIWDASYGFYRWIPNEAVFNKYGFSWSKIKSYGSFGPIDTPIWWE